MLDDYLCVLDIVLPIVLTVPVWGPLLLAGVIAALVWPHRPARRRAPGHVPGTARARADTGPGTDTPSAVTCADTRPDVSADPSAEASGHEARGA